ncbi:dual OB domain-containing protein [Pseudomonas sp. TE3911]
MVATQREFVCLANSKKHGERCIAGKLIGGPADGTWYRPVSNRASRGISENEATYQAGGAVNALDIISIWDTAKHQHVFQQENYIIDATQKWVKKGDYVQANLSQLIDTPARLWETNYKSTSGVNDRVPERLLTQARQTLYFIKPDGDVSVKVDAEGKQWNNHKISVRATFDYNGINYALSLTDIPAEAYFLKKGIGTYSLNKITGLTISLSEVHTNVPNYVVGQGFAYKVIAGIF